MKPTDLVSRLRVSNPWPVNWNLEFQPLKRNEMVLRTSCPKKSWTSKTVKKRSPYLHPSLPNDINLSLQTASLIAQIELLQAQLGQLNARDAESRDRIADLQKEALGLRGAKSDAESKLRDLESLTASQATQVTSSSPRVCSYANVFNTHMYKMTAYFLGRNSRHFQI